MSTADLDDLERREKALNIQAARAYAEIEALSEDINKIEAKIAALGLESIEDAKALAARVLARGEEARTRAKELIEEAEAARGTG